MSENYNFVSTTNMLIIDNGKLLVIKRDENLKDFPGWLMLPGGKQNAAETPEKAAIRETFEETGLNVKNPKLRVVATHNHLYRNKVYLVYIFIAIEFSGDLIEYEEGKGAPVWLPIQEALEHKKLYPDLKRHIRLATDPERNDIIFTYHKFNKELEIIETI